MEVKLGKILKYVLSLGVAALLMYFCFRGVEWTEFAESLSGCRWWWVAASIAAGVLSNWFRSERWREILLPVDPQTGHLSTFNAVNIGYLANFAFPRIGELVRCGVVSKDSRNGKAGYDRVLGTVVTERSLDMLVMLLILFLFLASRWERFGSFFVEKIWVPLSGRIDFSLWWIVLAAVLLAVLAAVLLVRFRKSNALAARVWGFVRGIWEGVVSCFRMEGWWKFLVYTVLIWLMYFLMSYTSMRAVPMLDGLTPADAMFLMLAGSLGWVVPVPGGFGAFHYIVALALSTVYGLPFELGIVFATVSHESQSLMMAVTGFVSYAAETVGKWRGKPAADTDGFCDENDDKPHDI